MEKEISSDAHETRRPETFCDLETTPPEAYSYNGCERKRKKISQPMSMSNPGNMATRFKWRHGREEEK
jgi:hypothetical protein